MERRHYWWTSDQWEVFRGSGSTRTDGEGLTRFAVPANLKVGEGDGALHDQLNRARHERPGDFCQYLSDGPSRVLVCRNTDGLIHRYGRRTAETFIL